MGLISLVYFSFATRKMTEDDLKDILRVARENNEKLGVTGMLLYRDGFFMQALEGEASTIVALYDKIRQDPRHTNATAMEMFPIQERTFINWHMGFNKFSDTAPDGIEEKGYTDFLTNPNSEFFTEKPDRAHILLNSFRNQLYF